MSDKNKLYLEEYLTILNDEIKKHQKYRVDMKFTDIDPSGNVVFSTKDKVTSIEDRVVIEEVIDSVSNENELVIA